MLVAEIMETRTHLPVFFAAPSHIGCGSCPMFTRNGKGSGFTLIELIIVITILGVLTSIALPSFSGFIAEQRIKTASFDVVSTLMLARSEALKRNTNVTVTKVGSNWANGWSVTAIIGGATTTISQQSAYKNLTIDGPPSSLSYNSSGRLATAETDFEISNSDSSSVRCIRIDLSGRPNSKKEACG